MRRRTGSLPAIADTDESTPAEPRPTLATRWSMLDRLHGSRADEAWRWFLERYRPVIAAVLARQLPPGHRDAALDEFWSYLFTSDVFDKAQRERRFRTFLCAVARNYALDWRRRNAVARADLDDAPEPVAHDPVPEAAELGLWARHLLHLGLARLSKSHPDDAKALQWFYGVSDAGAPVEPLRVAEIARRLERKVNAIHQLLHRGRARLRRYVEAELRETVRDPEELRSESELILDAIHGERPGLLH